MRAADARVSGKGDFLVWREHAHPIAALRGLRRQQEGGFHQVGPARDALHRRGIQAFAVHHYAERIAAAEAGGKHIELKEAGSVHGGVTGGLVRRV